MWGSFGALIDLPKQEDSGVTMEGRLTNDLQIEVRTKLVTLSCIKIGLEIVQPPPLFRKF